VSAAVQAGGVSLVVVAASSGGFEACSELFSLLPADFAAPVVLVQHRAERPDVLAGLLRQRSGLRVATAIPGALPAPGTVYLADSVPQLLLDADGRFVDSGPASSHCRADDLLEAAAAAHGQGLVAVILSGRLRDGALGVVAVKKAGGRVIAQDRESSGAFGMPSAAIATGCVDDVLPPEGIAAALLALLGPPAAGADVSCLSS